jgi:hypothetical protein
MPEHRRDGKASTRGGICWPLGAGALTGLKPEFAPGCRLRALQQSHTPPKKRHPVKLRFTRPAPELSCGYG